MGMGSNRAIASLVMVGSLVLGTSAVTLAQTAEDIADEFFKSQAGHFAPVPDAFDEAFFRHDPDFYRNRSIGRQFNFIFGITGFLDQEINRDGQEIFNVYRSQLSHQLASGPILRTPDLPNPFNSSLLGCPTSVQFSCAMPTPRLPAPITGYPPVEGVAPSQPSTKPVPSLW
jgi:hypothetical protein